MSTFLSLRRSALAVALVACLLCLVVLISMPVKADVLSTIKSECATLGATQYQIAFVTSDGTTATSSKIQDYNNFVTAEAVLGSSYLSDFVPPGATWKAIASTDSANAITNAPVYSGVPIFNAAGQLLTVGPLLYSDSGLQPLLDDQFGDAVGGTSVWTGSHGDGTEAYSVDPSGYPLGLGDWPNFGDYFIYPMYGYNQYSGIGSGWLQDCASEFKPNTRSLFSGSFRSL